jgi:arsenite methyltransferase
MTIAGPRRKPGVPAVPLGGYGLDAPRVVAAFVAAAAVGVVCLLVSATTSADLWGLGVVLAAVGGSTSAAMLHSSLRGKIILRDRVLNSLSWRGDEDVLDLGTGGGLLLLGAAARSPGGVATGIDLWRGVDQAGPGPARCWANAETLGLQDRIRVLTGDMSALPLPDGSVDVVLACLAIHNIPDPGRRRRTLDEAARVLRPAGRLVVIDFAHTSDYVSAARAAGLTDVTRSSTSFLMWPPVRIVTARKPAVSWPVADLRGGGESRRHDR